MKSKSHRRMKAVPGFSGYMACTDGSLWTCRVKGHHKLVLDPMNWVEVKGYHEKSGYIQITLRGDNGAPDVMKRLHEIILLTFKGPPPENCDQTRHLDDVKSNNDVENLEWGNTTDNTRDKRRNGIYAFGKRDVTNEEVKKIRAMHAQGFSRMELVKLLDIKYSTIRFIVTGQSHKGVK